MSSDNPPYPYYPSIPFNPSFFTSNTGTGLTESTANALYLRKTVSDTAIAQETFSSGIVTNAITASAVSSTMAIGSNLTTGNMTLGSALTTGNINLGNNNTSIVQVNGRLQTNFVRSKDIINTLEIGDDQTSGSLNLGYRPADGLRTGAVNIGSANATTTVYGTLNVPTSGGASSNAVNVTYLNTALANMATLNQVQIFTGTNTFNNNSVTFNRPLTIGYTIQPTSTQLGYQVDGTLLAGATQVGATPVLVSTITLPTTGVWNIMFVLQFISLGQTQMVTKLIVPAPESTTYNYPAPLQLGSTFYFQTNGSYTGYFTGSTVSLTLDGGSGTVFSSYYGKFRAVRVA